MTLTIGALAGQLSAQDPGDPANSVTESVPAQDEGSGIDEAPPAQEVETAIPEEPLPEPPVEAPEPAVEPAPTGIPAPSEGEAPPPAEPTVAAQALLLYTAVESPTCAPRSGDPLLAAGGEVIYDCTYTVSLAGEHIDPSSIAVDWSVRAHAVGDLGVRLLIPAVDETQWTEAGLAQVERVLRTTSDDAGSGVVVVLEDVATLAFSLAIDRPACSEIAGNVELAVDTVVSTTSDAAVLVTDGTPSRSSILLEPALLAIDVRLPAVSILAVSVDPVEFSLFDTQTTGSLTIQVDNPVLQCHASRIAVAVQITASEGAVESAYLSWVGPLDESTVAMAAPITDGEGGALDGFVTISTVPGYAEPGSYLQTVSFELTVPGAVVVGTYHLDASAVVEPAE